jgi:hypothetical protein
MIIIKEDINNKDQPLTWRYYKYKGEILKVENHKKQLVKLIVIVCSNGHYLGIIDHDISNDGTVNPSVVCPIKDCSFHDYIKLEGYDKGCV